MRLNLSLTELDQGAAIQGGNRDRITKLRNRAMSRRPVACYPVQMHDGRRVAAVFLTQDVEPTPTADVRLHFRPVWCKAFSVCSMRKDTLSAMLLEFEFGKYWVDRNGVRETNQMTTGGNGCDPAVISNSDLVLGDMLSEDKRTAILSHIINLIQRSF